MWNENVRDLPLANDHVEHADGFDAGAVQCRDERGAQVRLRAVHFDAVAQMVAAQFVIFAAGLARLVLGMARRRCNGRGRYALQKQSSIHVCLQTAQCMAKSGFPVTSFPLPAAAPRSEATGNFAAAMWYCCGEMRIILYAGKGGVGKTSVSAATGLELARRGLKTLVMSVDPAHSLSDAFDMDRRLMDHTQGRIAKVRNNLWIQEVDIQDEIQRHWQEVHRYISALLNVTGLGDVLAEELAIFPGMEELSSMLYINQYIQEERFDAILLDCAPTGESLRFVSMPTTLEWYMQKFFTAQRQVAKVVRPMLSRITSIPLPGDEYFENIERLYERLKGVNAILNDPHITTVRLVTTPEKMVLKETQRAFVWFCLYGLTVDAVIVNRILPDHVNDSFFKGWKSLQERYVAAVEEMFAPLPIWKLQLFDSEVLGVRELDRLAKTLYATVDPAAIYF